jgi:HEPN domain-containing protein
MRAEWTAIIENRVNPLDSVCFHAQQCAEKYLKTLVIELYLSFLFDRVWK